MCIRTIRSNGQCVLFHCQTVPAAAAVLKHRSENLQFEEELNQLPFSGNAEAAFAIGQLASQVSLPCSDGRPSSAQQVLATCYPTVLLC